MTTEIRWVRLGIATILAAAFVALFMSLGIWQVHRLHWKLDLIWIGVFSFVYLVRLV